ncbi:MAG: EamA family transporter RarD [Synergistaceae bacterium]|nr:EamA family transporter RarD [Synergistaceae bacterium]
MKESQRGVAALFLSYFFWGSMPIYWKAIQNIPSGEILAHRVVWSMAFTLAVVVVQKKWHIIAEFIRTDRRGSLCLLCGGFLITANWWIYIWAVNNGKILETSLGYFINPLVSMAFGMLFFHEKLRRLQWAALILAVTGVCVEFISTHSISMVSIGLAMTFGVYGVLKKAVSIDPVAGLFIETAAVTPLALAWLICAQNSGAAAFPYDTTTDILLAGTGVMTSVPLILFAFGAKRVPLTTLGFVQYVSPTLYFIIGTFIYNEPLLMSRICTFAFIWTALAVYTADAVAYHQAQRR